MELIDFSLVVFRATSVHPPSGWILNIPLIIDWTRLPSLVAGYRGFDLSGGANLENVVTDMTGNPRDLEIAKRLQTKLLELTAEVSGSGDPLPYLVCPLCASEHLAKISTTDHRRDESYFTIKCKDCSWSEWTQ